MIKYYDPEYDREVTEKEIERQYAWFMEQPWYCKSYLQFRSENFSVILPKEE